MTASEQDIIAIDDAGGGNLLGGIVLGGVCGERYVSRVIGPEWFAMGVTVRSLISAMVIDMVIACDSPRRVVLCRSDLFDQSARDLRRLGYTVDRAAINGRLQDKTEEDFFKHLVHLGLPRHIMRLMPKEDDDKGKCYRSLNEYSTRFLLADFSARRHMAKQNCRSFKKLAEIRTERIYRHKLDGPRSRRCVECGEDIRENAYLCKAGTCQFYVHKSCAPWTRRGHSGPSTRAAAHSHS